MQIDQAHMNLAKIEPNQELSISKKAASTKSKVSFLPPKSDLSISHKQSSSHQKIQGSLS